MEGGKANSEEKPAGDARPMEEEVCTCLADFDEETKRTLHGAGTLRGCVAQLATGRPALLVLLAR